MNMPPLKGITAFEIVARLGSINKAAEELSLTPSAVSHQLANVEAYIGRKLFERTSRGLLLTPVGERFLQDISGALALMATAARNARAADGAELLRIHVSPSLAGLWLMPRLPQFLAAHPDIRLQISASHTHSDFARGEVDVDIRYGAARWRDLHVETLFAEQLMPLASPALAQRLGPLAPEDLIAQDLIFSEVNLIQWPRWFAAHGVALGPTDYALKFDRAMMAIGAAAQGLGIALESNRLAEQSMLRGELIPLFEDHKAIEVHAHHLVYPPQHGQWSKVERFANWLRQECARPA